MKQILFVMDTLRMGGAEKSLVNLLKIIEPKKYQINLLVFEEGGILEREIPKWVNIVYVDKITRAMLLEFRKYGKDLLKKGRIDAYLQRVRLSLNKKRNIFGWNVIKKYIDIVENEYDIAISYLEGAPAFYVIDKVKAKKKITWIHIDMTDRDMCKAEQEYYYKFDHIVTISEVCKTAFVTKCPKVQNRISIIENILLEEDVRKKSEQFVNLNDWSKECTNIVTIGRLDFQKGIDIGIEACRVLVDNKVPICWHVYGKGSQKDYLDKLIENSKLQGIFKLEGMVENPYPYMKNADIIVQPSRFEGKSIVLDEAKLLGKAIVVTNYLSVTDQIINEETGIIVDINAEAIAQGIIRIINDKVLKQKLERQCKENLQKPEHIVEKLYGLLDD